jgi:hypothetical protein
VTNRIFRLVSTRPAFGILQLQHTLWPDPVGQTGRERLGTVFREERDLQRRRPRIQRQHRTRHCDPAW